MVLALAALAVSPAIARPHRHAAHAAKRSGPNRSSIMSRQGFGELTSDRESAAVILMAPKAILVSKSAKTLTLLEAGIPVRTFPVAIGRSETGAKETSGDWRTPEGLYYVAGHNAASRFHLALRLSYPNADDASRGLATGLITEAQAAAIRTAIAEGALPPQNTPLGQNVEIHGGYHFVAGAQKIRSYTRGCVALTNDMIAAIYAWAPDGTPVLIRP